MTQLRKDFRADVSERMHRTTDAPSSSEASGEIADEVRTKEPAVTPDAEVEDVSSPISKAPVEDSANTIPETIEEEVEAVLPDFDDAPVGDENAAPLAADTNKSTETDAPIVEEHPVKQLTALEASPMALAEAAATNLVQNGDFEQVARNLPTGWSKGSWGSLTPTFTYPVPGVTGNAAQVSVSGYQNGDAKWYHAAVGVTAGARYTYTNSYKATVATELVAQYQTSAGAMSYVWLGSLPAATTWTTASVPDLVVPTGVTKLTVFHLIAGNGTVTIDNVALAAGGATPPPPTPQPLVAAALANPTSGVAPLPVSFSASASGGTGIYTYSWAFGDGTNASIQNPSHTYAVAGSYTATLSVSDGSVSTSTSVTMQVSAPTTPPPPTDPANLIANGDLELSSAGLPTSWSQGSWGTLTPTFTYPIAGANGQGAQLTVSGYQSGDAKWVHTAVPVTGGTKYRYSAQYKATNDTHLVVEYKDANGALSYMWLTSPATVSVWSPLSIDFVVPASAVSATVFHLLAANGTLSIDSVKLETLASVPPSSGKAMVSITFDDGWLSQYQNAVPLLDTYGVDATFYIITDTLVAGKYDGYMSKTQVKNLAVRGHEVGSHTITHPNLTAINATSLAKQLNNSRTTLKNVLGKDVVSLAYPYGEYNTNVIAAAKTAGYTNARTVEDDLLNTAATDVYRLKSYSPTASTPLADLTSAMDRAIENNEWLVIALHEINGTGNEYSNTPEYLEALLVAIRDKGIPAVTISEGLTRIAE